MDGTVSLSFPLWQGGILEEMHAAVFKMNRRQYFMDQTTDMQNSVLNYAVNVKNFTSA